MLAEREVRMQKRQEPRGGPGALVREAESPAGQRAGEREASGQEMAL